MMPESMGGWRELGIEKSIYTRYCIVQKKQSFNYHVQIYIVILYEILIR